MVRLGASKIVGTAAVAMLSLAAVTLGCSRRLDGGAGGGGAGVGSVRLFLQIMPGVMVSSVHWQISSTSGSVVRQGDITTIDPSSTASVDTSCPAGADDTVTFTATTSNGLSCAGHSSAFNVIAGATVSVTVTLVCGGGTPMQPNGSVIVGANVVAGDYCPLLTSWEASPSQVAVGRVVDVSASAIDQDAGDVLSYVWTATSGSFFSPSSASTTYQCSSAGPQTLTIAVIDNHTPTPCATRMSLVVECTPLSECGNGVVDPGETCDPPNGTTCSATCQSGECGDGIVQVGEQCDPPNPANHCSVFCTLIPYCGDGHIDPGEQCDPPGPLPDGTTCDANCQVPCLGPTNNACTTCERADVGDCPASLNVVPGAVCGGWGCEGFSPVSPARAHCQALYECIRTSGCMMGDDPTPCLCGSLTPASCVNAGPPASAPCAAQYAAAAADASNLGPVTSQFSNPSSPVGIADNQAVCAVDSAITSGCVCP